jgi:hypothetical protein
MNILHHLMRRVFAALAALAVPVALAGATGNFAWAQERPLRFQLNWFHDPSFAAAYKLQASSSGMVQLMEGGPAVFPLTKLRTGEAQIALVGVDVFLRAVGEDLESGRDNPFRLLGVDFQRNPVGYLLHPEVGEAMGLPQAQFDKMSERERNDWVFQRIQDGQIKVGDKTGTETTAVWLAWKSLRAPNANVPLVSVGFDPQILLQKPRMIYPVYLNEEPYKLRDKIGREFFIFDPAADGLTVYGNVLVTSSAALERARTQIVKAKKAYFDAWDAIKQNRPEGLQLVRQNYRNVPESTVDAQLKKTLEFVFYNNASPGDIEQAPGGRLDISVRVFRDAKAISSQVALDKVLPLIARE